MINRNLLDTPVEIGEGSLGGTEYTHPSYGMISVSRINSSHGTKLFGSEIESNNYMEVVIKQARNTQSLGRNWCYGYEALTSVIMTPVQYAEMISNPNTEGIPCTINYTRDVGRIVYKPHGTQVEYVEQKMNDISEGMVDKLHTSKTRAKELLSAKGTLKKADKEELLDIIQSMGGEITSLIPFYQNSMKENLERMKMEAKTEVECFVENALSKLGSKLLDNPETVKLLLDSSLEDEK